MRIKIGPQSLWIAHIIIFMVFWSINSTLIATGHYDVSKFDSLGSKIMDALYLTITTHTTTGYGDITPISPVSKFFAATHQIIVYMITAGFIIFSLNDLKRVAPTPEPTVLTRMRSAIL